MRGQGKLDEAIAEYREAIRLQPDYAVAHTNLGNVLCDSGQDSTRRSPNTARRSGSSPTTPWPTTTSATPCRTRASWTRPSPNTATAIRLKPDDAVAHCNLGNALRDQGKLDEAIAEYRTAIRLKPDYAEAYCNLGVFLQQQGHFTEALEMLRKGHELGSRRPDWQYPSAQWVAEAERNVPPEKQGKLDVDVDSLRQARTGDQVTAAAERGRHDLGHRRSGPEAGCQVVRQGRADRHTRARQGLRRRVLGHLVRALPGEHPPPHCAPEEATPTSPSSA